jgi:O-antigen/teichoic acid export membrane protein
LVPLVATIASLGTQTVYGRYASRYESQGTLTWFIKRIYTLTVVLSVVFTAVMFLRTSQISSLLYRQPGLTWVIVAVAASIPAYLLIRNLSSTFMGLKLFRAGAFPEFVQNVIYLAVGIPLALALRTALAGLIGFAVATYASVAIFSILLMRYLHQREPVPREGAERKFYRHLLSFSIWFVVAPCLTQVFRYVDRLTLQHLRGSYDQGVYSAASNVAETLSAFGLAIGAVIYPHISATWERGRRDEAKAQIDLTTRITGVLLLVLGLLVTLLAKWLILLLLGKQYVPGTVALPYLIVYYIFSVMVWILGVYPTLIERTYVAAVGLAVTLPINILLNRLLIPHFGMVGAALATMLAYFLMWIIVEIICLAYGLRLAKRTVLVSLLPFVLLLPDLIRRAFEHLGPAYSTHRTLALLPDCTAVVAVGIVIYVCLRRPWILSPPERDLAFKELRQVLAKARNFALKRR